MLFSQYSRYVVDAPLSLSVFVGCMAIVITTSGCHRDVESESADENVSKQSQVHSVADGLERADWLCQNGRSNEALPIVVQLLEELPENSRALRLAADIHAARGEFGQAAEYGEILVSTQPKDAEELLNRCFDWNLRVGKYEQAEANLLAAIEVAPHGIQAHRLLAQLYNAQGRRVESRPHVEKLIRLKAITHHEMLSLIDLRGPFSIISFDDVIDESKISLFRLGKARLTYADFRSNRDEVISTVASIVEAFPLSTSAAAFYGRALIENGRSAELSEWFGRLPAGIEQQPEYWTTLGLWLQQNNRHPEAIRSFGEALQLDSGNREALRDMIVSLDATGSEQQAIALRTQLAVLDKIVRVAHRASAERCMWIASEMQTLARPWEALAWMMHSARIDGKLPQIIPELDRRAALVTQWEQSATPERVGHGRVNKLLRFNIHDWPLPPTDISSQIAADPEALKRIRGTTADLATKPSDLESESEFKFADVASELGINTSTDTGFFDQDKTFYAHQVDGSGIGILDYDLNGLPDIYVMQSSGPPNDAQGSDPNQLLRSLPDHSFANVTEESGTVDQNYGAGVAVGDLNQDGFPDLLLGNVGASVLFINQGDGCFRNASELMQENPVTWTSSVAIADLSGDNLPEIIQVNYIDDGSVFKTQCVGGYLHCQPQKFRAAADRLFKGNADGTFSIWKSISTIADDPKLGLGLLVANFDKHHGNDVFIANDGDLNHYWTSLPDAVAEDKFAVVESANLRGCSIGQGGVSQACMGIAGGDFNRDGRLDMHITNFYHEPVNLFIQNRLGFFSDQATRYGLNKLSMPVLGFGTQARDFNNDGWLDLATLNGHVFDASEQGMPFRMKPQLMAGERSGFVSVQPGVAGPYWQREQLGRALATFDLHQDGRMDLVANHLDQPVAILQNNSAAQNWLQLELIGTRSERDAVGAEATVTAGSESWTSYRTAGDGYMVSNEAVLHFGVGAAETLTRVDVRWPSGLTQSFDDIAPNSRYLLVEGAEEMFPRKRP